MEDLASFFIYDFLLYIRPKLKTIDIRLQVLHGKGRDVSPSHELHAIPLKGSTQFQKKFPDSRFITIDERAIPGYRNNQDLT